MGIIISPIASQGGSQLLTELSKTYYMVLSLLLLIGIGILFLYIGNAVKKNKQFGKVIGIIIGVVLLFVFPVGTIPGIFILYYLVKGWKENREKRTEKSGKEEERGTTLFNC